MSALELVTEDGIVIAPRMPLFDPTSVPLDAYTGRYYSPELDAVYSLVVEGGRMTAVHARHGSIPLVPAGPDRFSLDGMEVRFERGADGTVTGMRISSESVRNVWFQRVEW